MESNNCSSSINNNNNNKNVNKEVNENSVHTTQIIIIIIGK
jgi:hypothetical protein